MNYAPERVAPPLKFRDADSIVKSGNKAYIVHSEAGAGKGDQFAFYVIII
jgi:hypothetical protein